MASKLGSITDGRLLVQAHAMRKKTPWAYIVITGALAPEYHLYAFLSWLLDSAVAALSPDLAD